MIKLSRLGFSLIEMSIVLVIVGILAVGALSVASIQIEAANVTQTNAKLDKIERAIQLYFEINGHLPCPASGDLPKSDANFGLSMVDGGGNCTSGENDSGLYNGVVPSRTLNLSDNTAIDAWGQRITYVVNTACVLSVNWPQILPDYSDACALATIQITDNNTPPIIKNANAAAYVLISHGKNKNGAWGNNGGLARITGNTPADGANELDNTDFGDAFVEDSLADAEDMVGIEHFDDLVLWKTGAQIQYEKDN